MIPTPSQLAAQAAVNADDLTLPPGVEDALALALQDTTDRGGTVTVVNLTNPPYSASTREAVSDALEKSGWMVNYFPDTKVLHVYPR